MHAGDYCSPFSLEPFNEANVALLGIFGRNDGDPEGLKAAAARGVGMELYESPHSFEVSGHRILIVHDLGEVNRRSIESHRFVVHGFTHKQETIIARRYARRQSGRGLRLADREVHCGDSRSRDERGRNHHRMKSRILILDYGAQYTQLIARRVREARVYSEIHPPTRSVEWIREWNPTGIILSGGPNSVYADNAPRAERELFDVAPVLGICYGMQLIGYLEGAEVKRAGRREYGRADVRVTEPGVLFDGFDVDEQFAAWMSHGDHVESPPRGYVAIASSNGKSTRCVPSRIEGQSTASSFIRRSRIRRGAARSSRISFSGSARRKRTGRRARSSRIEVARIRDHGGQRARDLRIVRRRRLRCRRGAGASRNRRSVSRAFSSIPDCSGLHEREQVERTFRQHMGIKLVTVDASARFLDALAGVEDPEKKRTIIGHTFIDVFEEAAADAGADAEFLVQGTLYPDVIESSSPTGGPSVTIKTHHNVGGLKPGMKFKLIEPLRELFKDEVRSVGRELGLSEEMVGRHPFPGPGLAIRVLSNVTRDKLDVLRAADAIYLEEIRSAGLYDSDLAGIRGSASGAQRRRHGRRADI